MIECILTLDYEIYGDGRGSLRDLVFEPARRLKEVFDRYGAKLVLFVEAAELEMIEAAGADEAIDDVKRQIRDFHHEGHEIALHLHPQWYNGRRDNGRWQLDYSEYNLCTLGEDRIESIVNRSIEYLRKVLNEAQFTPLSFRAGNWLLQPSAVAARVLSRHGIKIDSSVYKGGRQRKHGLDYRPALRNGDYWPFRNDVNIPDANGLLLEVPVYTRMVPFWTAATRKRLGLQAKSASSRSSFKDRFYRLSDLARYYHPQKFDFCRMTLGELISTVDECLRRDRSEPAGFRPMTAIGHTKDLTDFATIDRFLSRLRELSVRVTTMESIARRLPLSAVTPSVVQAVGDA